MRRALIGAEEEPERLAPDRPFRPSGVTELGQFGAGETSPLLGEDRLDGLAEQAGDLEGERQAGVVFAGLDGVDALARDVEPPGEFGLTPVALGAQHFQAVFHRLAIRQTARAMRAPSPTDTTARP